MKALGERIIEDGISVEYVFLGLSSDGFRRVWKVELRCLAGETFALPEPYESADEPTPFDVMDHLLSSCSIIDQTASRYEWASEYVIGGDPEEEHFTQRNFDTWKGINEGLKGFLGAKHADYLYETDGSR
jgi:hypothetical protein